MNNIIFYDMLGNRLTHYFQWDINQYMVVDGLVTDPLPVFQFANRRRCVSRTVVPSIAVDGKLIAKVPNEFFEEPDDIHVYIYRETSTGAARTLGEIRVKVIPRKKPESFDGDNENEVNV